MDTLKMFHDDVLSTYDATDKPDGLLFKYVEMVKELESKLERLQAVKDFDLDKWLDWDMEVKVINSKLEAADQMQVGITTAFKKFPVQLDGNVVMGMRAYNEIVDELNKAFSLYDNVKKASE